MGHVTGSRVGPENSSNLTSLRPRDGAYHRGIPIWLAQCVGACGADSCDAKNLNLKLRQWEVHALRRKRTETKGDQGY
jgi:hypothetical protein